MYDLIVLTFRQPLRGHEQRAGYLPSDTLWGALYANDVLLQGSPIALAEPFRVSSAFPYVAGEWLLPKPRVSAEAATAAAPSSSTEGGSSEKKKAKSLQYVRLGDFLQLAAGKRLAHLDEALYVQRRALLPVVADDDLPITLDEESLRSVARASGKDIDVFAQSVYGVKVAELSQTERFHLLSELRGRTPQGRSERQRNTQDRVTQKTDTFMTTATHPPRLAFLLFSTSSEQRERLLASLRLLGDRGLGGLRSQGSGQFDFDVTAVAPELLARLDKGERSVLLSLTHPAHEELAAVQHPEARYSLLRRGGALDGTGSLRKDVWMLTEGSLLSSQGRVNGRLVDVAPEAHAHPVWRSGLAVSLSVGDRI